VLSFFVLSDSLLFFENSSGLDVDALVL